MFTKAIQKRDCHGIGHSITFVLAIHHNITILDWCVSKNRGGGYSANQDKITW